MPINAEALADDLIAQLRVRMPAAIATVIAATDTATPIVAPSPQSYYLGEWSRFRPYHLPACFVIWNRSPNALVGNIEKWEHQVLVDFLIEGRDEASLTHACFRMAEAAYACLHDQDLTGVTAYSVKTFVESIEYGPMIAKQPEGRPFRKDIFLKCRILHFDQQTMAPYALLASGSGAGGGGSGGGGNPLILQQNGTAVVSPSTSAINFIEPDATVLTNSPGGTGRVDLSGYVLASGRPGGQTIAGGVNVNDNLILLPNIAPGFAGRISFYDPTVAEFTLNGFGKPRLIIGGDTDPTTVFVPSGILSFLVEADGDDARYGAYAAGHEHHPQFVAICAEGSVAAPATVLDGSALFTVQSFGYDTTPVPTLAGGFQFQVDGPPSAGIVPGSLTFFTFSASGIAYYLSMRSDGSLGNSLSPASGAAAFTIQAQRSTVRAHVIQGAIGQMAPLAEYRNSAGIALGAFLNDASWQPPLIADSSAANGTAYVSTTASGLVFKDYNGIVRALY